MHGSVWEHTWAIGEEARGLGGIGGRNRLDGEDQVLDDNDGA